MTILVTGGCGFIGSHAGVVLQDAGYEVLVLDNLCNSNREVIERIEQITGKAAEFVEGDIRDSECLNNLFTDHNISAVMHFAGLKAVGESVAEPEKYYANNVKGSRTLFAAMQAADVKTLVFSSSATVYGDPASVPIREDFPRSATNPYGETKLKVEDILADMQQQDSSWRLARLRYFNPVGAHASGLIGEDPDGIPNNLMPFISQTAAGIRDHLSVFGSDYPTPDGTGIRDYIHVVDLAEGHLAALQYLEKTPGMLTVNLGTGKGASVLEMIHAFEQVNQCKVPYRIVDRRAGDIAECWADTSLAEDLLGWQASRTLDDMCKDTWRWQQSRKPA
ncbi:MAG: UDP-glucose 4-epimerase GalE [Xanthomonadales bacterium]|nr:UDP-glucose 4-epimerase GalE [Xanthomonadales bacterium]